MIYTMNMGISSEYGKGFAQVITDVKGNGGTVFLARKDARRNANRIFENEWARFSSTETKNLVNTRPKGLYKFVAQLVIDANNPGYGCGSGDVGTVHGVRRVVDPSPGAGD